MPAEPTLRLIQGEAPGSSLPPELVALPDDQLAVMVQNGVRAAFEVLYRRYLPYTMNLATRLTGGGADAEDVVHDAFLRAHGNICDLRDPSAFRAWLGAIVVRLVRTRLRRTKLQGFLGLSRPNPVDLDSLASSTAGPEIRAELAQVYALLGLLAADDRIAWTLRVVEQHRLEDVASLCDCSLATAKRRISRAQRFLEENFVRAGKDAHDVR